jgi:glutaminase
MNYSRIIKSVFENINQKENCGQLASYIPELATINPEKFAVHLSTVENQHFAVGDYQDRFSIQSIAKVFSMILAYKILDSDMWSRVGVEPSGTAFNSLVQLETDNGIPRNPFINSGALVVCDILVSHLGNAKMELLEFIRNISTNKNINYSEKIASSEKSVGYRNVALCNFIKSYGNIENNPYDVLDLYFNLCSIEMSCEELSKAFLFLANQGRNNINGYALLTTSQTKRINAIMQTCGFYDESGEFAFKVGLPGKSGVGGGIIAIHPNQYAIAVWSPKLNQKFNSYRGMIFLEQFTTKTELSIF